MSRVFLLSPANSGGERAQMLLRREANFPLAQRIRTAPGAPLGEVFSFLSGLYFRGKLAYARAFARPPAGFPGALIITSNRGLLPAETMVTRRQLRQFSRDEIDLSNPGYREPLLRDAQRLAAAECEVVLLGSVATGKYVNIFLELLQERLLFPAEFVGRGDMSRGGLMLRCAVDGCELTYVPVAGALRRGKRPPKLTPRRDLQPKQLLRANSL